MPNEYKYSSADDLARTLAGSIAGDLQAEGILVLPGGSSPRLLISYLAQSDLDWSKITITTTDERCVSLDSADSNAGQIVRLFKEKNVHVQPFILWQDGRINDIQALGQASVTVLGMGTDGHIASIFPDTPEYEPGEDLIESRAPNPPHERISMTYERLENTKRLILILSGEEKRALYQRITNGEKQDLPLARLINNAKQELDIHIVNGD